VIKSAVTISLVPEARGGPFVFSDDLEGACRKAAALGFDAIELFAADASSIAWRNLPRLLDVHGLKLAAAGTGAGWVKHKLTLTSPDPSVRSAARDFVRSIIEAAGAFGAPAVIGSMQGRWAEPFTHDDALSHLQVALRELEGVARGHGVPLLFEPLNRYETNVINSVELGTGMILAAELTNTRLLADLFHMNIEEPDVPDALRAARKHLGHIHFADSNRRPAGCGHTDFSAVAGALREIGYDGYVSAECLPYPDPGEAARLTIESFQMFFR
jgi:sugar phosphate isomerase/epimerase